MGTGMAKNLLKAGFPVSVYNRTRAKAEPLGCGRRAHRAYAGRCGANADVIISMLSDENASARNMDGERGRSARRQARDSARGVKHRDSCVDRRACSSRRSTNLSLLDAPVTGSRVQAEGGQLIFLVGGDARRPRTRSASACGHEQRDRVARTRRQRSTHETHQQLPLRSAGRIPCRRVDVD